MSGSDILVVGAGPTGLALALQAHDHGARVRVVERRPEALRPSRALVVHPRTLEVLRPRGVSEEILARAEVALSGCLHVGSRAIRVELAQLALPDTPFPHLTMVRQMDVESVLSEALDDRGVPVERGTELIGEGDASGADGTRVTLRTPNGIEEATCRYVVGCDGPASTVRTGVGIEWRGGPYAEEVVLADVELEGDIEAGVAHVVAGRLGLLFLFAIGERATWRLLATRPAGPEPPPFGRPGPPVPAPELQVLLDAAGFDARIDHLAWSARVPLQHRLAARFRQGRLFLAGDAAHAHSPAGAQGMNTGIQDAMNLGWKLALLSTRSVPAGALLASYEAERRDIARMTLALTHLLFWVEAGTGMVPSFLRGTVGPLAAPLVPVLLRQRGLTAQGIRVLSQLRWNYRHSPLSLGAELGGHQQRSAPHGRPGDRLPDATVLTGSGHHRLHELLATAGLHILLQRNAEPLTITDDLLHVHRVLSWPGRRAVVVRPDGHIGYRGPTADAENWLERLGLASTAEHHPRAHRVP